MKFPLRKAAYLAILVKLLDQQIAVPSATSLEEIDQDGLVLFLGLGDAPRREIPGKRPPIGRTPTRKEKESGQHGQIFHGTLL